ncbi:MAG: phosphoenolpyruvate hydrolase family protein [Chloroflexi bacterium]|nr:phosphoenolpyruvate hydrolase family protein [Chloroflexota bacterium]
MLYPRDEIVRRLRREVEAGRAIFCARCATGIAARYAEEGGADLIVTYALARWQQMGFAGGIGLAPFGDGNALAFEVGTREILPIIRDTPVLLGLACTDPTRRVDIWLQQIDAAGFSGINNWASVGMVDGNYRRVLENSGMGFDREVEFMRQAHAHGFFTLAYLFEPDQARAMAEAGVDGIVCHLGVGGEMPSLEETPEIVTAIAGAARAAHPDVLVLIHGGHIRTPADAAWVAARSPSVGYLGAPDSPALLGEVIKQRTQEYKHELE